MTWNYRLLEKKDGSIGIHEVYYDDNNQIVSWTDTHCGISGDSFLDCYQQLELMYEAFKEKALNEKVLEESLKINEAIK